MTSMGLRITIVTPETTTLDAEVDGVTVPMFDGAAGILPGHAPMIGRLGPGELKTTAGSTVDRFYVDGGFVQIEEDSISVLTGKSIPVNEIDLSAAKTALEEAEKMEAGNGELAAIRLKAINQAKAQIRLVENKGA
ncbi:MAG: ATP synthase F1 subunit epsilon [Planctomycetota bacterium]